jgi:hypothetical protein
MLLFALICESMPAALFFSRVTGLLLAVRLPGRKDPNFPLLFAVTLRYFPLHLTLTRRHLNLNQAHKAIAFGDLRPA